MPPDSYWFLLYVCFSCFANIQNCQPVLCHMLQLVPVKIAVRFHRANSHCLRPETRRCCQTPTGRAHFKINTQLLPSVHRKSCCDSFLTAGLLSWNAAWKYLKALNNETFTVSSLKPWWVGSVEKLTFYQTAIPTRSFITTVSRNSCISRLRITALKWDNNNRLYTLS